MRPTTSTKAERAWWGPVTCEMSDERTAVRAGDGPLVEIRCPWWPERGMEAIFGPLREGLPVLVDGEPRLTLHQPERRGLRRRGRRILIDGDPAIVPPGLFLRAPWQRVDRSVSPTLVAVWGAAHHRLLEATQVL